MWHLLVSRRIMARWPRKDDFERSLPKKKKRIPKKKNEKIRRKWNKRPVQK